MRPIFRLTVINAAMAVALLPDASRAADADCAQLTVKEPALREVIDRTRALRASVAKRDASFALLVSKAREAAAGAKRVLTEAQRVGCGPDESAMTKLEECTAPLQWSCESIAPSVDWRFLSAVAQSEDQKLAAIVGDSALSAPTNVFATCCGDFGCTQGGVGIPAFIHHREEVARLTRLATFDSDLGRVAFATLRESAEGLETATCSCENLSAKQLKDFSANLTFAAQKTNPDVIAATERIQRALAKGLPKARCKLPGY